MYSILNIEPDLSTEKFVNKGFIQLIEGLLQKDREKRIQTAKEVIQALLTIKDHGKINLSTKEIDSQNPALVIQGHRKLAAIMFTDIAGYTSLTQKNEILSLELLEEHRLILRQVFVQYNGREIETIGDAFFVEFEGALNAIRCAIEIQRKIYNRNIKQPSERKIKIRIGLHIGDVMHMGKHLHGDGVNIAARVHPLAIPGGIVISEDFWRQIKNITEFSFLTLGRFKLKGIEQPIKIYAVKNEGIATPSLNKRLLSKSPLIKKITITIAFTILLIFYFSPLNKHF